MGKKQDKKTSDILDNITASDAISILRVIIDRHKELEDEIGKIATELLCRINYEEVASDVRNELNHIEVEELWDRSGKTRNGYIDPSEESFVMFEETLDPFISTMKKYQKMGFTVEAKKYCIGIIKGIQEYDATSNSEFKDWAVDVPYEYIDTVLENWKSGKPSQSDIDEVEVMINEEGS